MLSLIDANPLGAWVCHTASGLVANHIPFVLDRSKGPHGTLIGHVSRANDIWRELEIPRPCVVMFQGPQAYITPGWYPNKQQHGEVVPTWNYVVTHAHGAARAIEDEDWLRTMLDRLVSSKEAAQPNPWHVSDAPPSYIKQMLRAIVGIEIPIDRIEGKLKASQDETMVDREGTVSGLRKLANDEAQSMARLVQQAIDGDIAAER
jgi:transcriptional regulator